VDHKILVKSEDKKMILTIKAIPAQGSLFCYINQ